MTATSALSASNANSFPVRAEPLRTVLLPGSPATYANRAVLRGLGLRWDPANHRWHGTTTVERVQELRERFGLEVRCFASLDAAPKGPSAPRPAPTRPAPALAVPTVRGEAPAPRPHDGSRTRVEAMVAFPSMEDEIPTPTRRFTVWETLSGVPDDSREADEKEAERQLRDLRGRVKAARALVSSTPGLSEVLAGDWKKAARFYAGYGITEEMLRPGVLSADGRGQER